MVRDGLLMGKRTVVTVAGPSGIGKTSFVNQMQWHLATSGIGFHAGKFDQYRQDQPYVAMLQIARSMLRPLLGLDRDNLERWRAVLQNAVGRYGVILTRFIPELAAIIGPQPEVDELPPNEAVNRFAGVIARFLAAFATASTPLVLFLDDLQWVDNASVNLLTLLSKMHGLSHLMFILGYRPDEVSPSHPAHRLLATIDDAAEYRAAITLGPLRREHVQMLVVETLGRADVDCQRLGSLIHGVAKGNAFFCREHLTALHKGGAVVFDDTEGQWRIDLARIEALDVPDTVAHVLAARLSTLPEETLALLDAASCIGNSFDLGTLSGVHQAAPERIANGLEPAIAAAILIPVDEVHRMVAALGLDGQDSGEASALGNAHYRFRHDQVRKAVHDRLDDLNRARLHLRIGRLLQQLTGKAATSQSAIKCSAIFRGRWTRSPIPRNVWTVQGSV